MVYEFLIILFSFFLIPVSMDSPLPISSSLAQTSLLDLDSFSNVASKVPSVTKFMDMMQNSPLIREVDDSGDITVFLPSNDAVDMYDFPHNGANLPSDVAFAIFSSHIILSNVKLDSVQHMQVPTVGNSVVEIDQDPFTLETKIAIGHETCYQSAKIENINAPIFTSNGIVYIISNILIPSPFIDYVKFHRTIAC